ncbi:hypothetical protein [Nocardiopsis sp. JB363]|uniref:hypothetical protein n=1 Tax=Nocardiopsis sp. JB363 TaxID=1434837 RepID=UPI000B35D2EC|nr:hypothetical protein [Nocardiopsis sp. JB363]
MFEDPVGVVECADDSTVPLAGLVFRTRDKPDVDVFYNLGELFQCSLECWAAPVGENENRGEALGEQSLVSYDPEEIGFPLSIEAEDEAVGDSALPVVQAPANRITLPIESDSNRS